MYENMYNNSRSHARVLLCAVIARFCKTSSPLLELMLPSQLWGVLWGLASCSHTPPEAWMDRFLGRCEAVMGESLLPTQEEGRVNRGTDEGAATGRSRADEDGRSEKEKDGDGGK